MDSKAAKDCSKEKKLQTLISLDKKGFIFSSDIPVDDFIDEAQATMDWAAGIREDIQSVGRAQIMEEEFTAEQVVPPDVLARCLQPARERYGIEPLWVPAFFSKVLLPWYVGGACFYGRENGEMRICFVLNHHFRHSEKWLFYSRKEIISHEICHVARSTMDQLLFEEPLAYRISESMFRRVVGPMFRGQWEASAFLGSSLILMGGSIARGFGAPNWVQYISYIPLITTVVLLGIRAAKASRMMKRAIKKLSEYYDDPEAVAFRCTDRELVHLADSSAGLDSIRGGDTDSDTENLRWSVIDNIGQPRLDKGNVR